MSRCKICKLQRDKEYRDKNLEKINAKRRSRNTKIKRQVAKVWRDNNPDKILEYRKRFIDKQSKNRELTNTKWREYYRNSAKMRAKQILKANERSRRISKQTPKWVKSAQILEIYKNCPEGFHVDHIIPLKGKTVSGLHVPWNLQYLSAQSNLKKSNKIST